MRQVDAMDVARRGVGVEREFGALLQHDGAVLECADAQLGALQVDENADRAAAFLLDLADHGDALAHAVVIGVAHVDAEEVRAGVMQRGDSGLVGGSRPKGRQDLAAAQSSHVALSSFLDAFGSAGPAQRVWPGSVSWTVQLRASLPVSTSKKPVRSKPRT